ncbi:MAG: transposase [Cyanobacteria bacterium P01_C01_bin.120]
MGKNAQNVSNSSELKQKLDDWYFSFKLRLVTNKRSKLLAFKLTPARILSPKLTHSLIGMLFGDRDCSKSVEGAGY